MTIPAVLFALAAVGGLVLAVQRFRGEPRPALPLALVHGLFAAAGLVTLALAVLGSEEVSGLAQAALVGFLVAALGGFVLFANHLQKKELPIPLVVIHALVAVLAFGMLVVALL